MAESLPPSAFCFTHPILKSIGEGGKVFTNQIPYQFLPYVVEISCLSFNDSEDSFQSFLKILKQGVRSHFNKLHENNFTQLLQRILDETKRMDPKFFGSLDYSTSVLERGFKLLDKKKIVEFSDSVISEIMKDDHESFAKLDQGP